MNSHIQMPRFILRNYADSYNSVSYYDVQNKNFVKKGRAKTINTQTEYYSQELEKKMNKEIEHPFSIITNKIISLFSDPDKKTFEDLTEPVLSKEEQLICRQFYYLLLAREPSIINAFDRNSTIYNTLSKTHKDDFTVTYNMDILCDYDMLQDFHYGILKNYTNKPMLLCNFGIISYYLNGELHYTLPLSPTIALTIYSTNENENDVDNNKIKMFLMKEIEQVDFLNRQTIDQQIRLGWGYICSNNYELLLSYFRK